MQRRTGFGDSGPTEEFPAIHGPREQAVSVDGGTVIVDWRVRRKRLRSIGDWNPFTIDLAVDFGIYPSYKTAARNVRRCEQVRWCRIRYIGSYYEGEGDRGRRRHVYCNRWRPAAHSFHHEVTMTAELKPWILAGMEVLRGPKVSRFLRPDASVEIGTEVIHFENDMDTEQPHDLKKKVNRYLTLVCDVPTATVVFIAPSEKRLDVIKDVTRPIASLCLYKLAGSDLLKDINGVALNVTDLL